MSGKTEAQGSYGEINAVLTGFEVSSNTAPSPPGALTVANILERYLGDQLEFQYVFGNGADQEPNLVWDGRIAAVRAGFRRTMRIGRRFLDRIMPGTLRPVRVALLDAATQRAAPSPVYVDYCARPTYRMLGKMPTAKLGWNKHMMPGTLDASTGAKAYSSDQIKDFKPSPFLVRMLDDHAGIFDLVPRLDSEGRTAELVPSLVKSLPSANVDEIARDSAILPTWEQCDLSRSHRIAVILSCTPAANDERRHLYALDVAHQDALRVLSVDTEGMSPELIRKNEIIRQQMTETVDSQRRDLVHALAHKDESEEWTRSDDSKWVRRETRIVK